MRVANILKGHDLFANLSVEEVNRISGFSECRSYRKNQLIFKYGDQGDHVFILLDGQVHLHLPAEPGAFRIVVSNVTKGDLFGLSSLLGSERYTLEAQAAGPAQALAINARKLRGLLQTNCLAGFTIMSEVAEAYFTRYVEILKRLQGIVTQIPLIASEGTEPPPPAGSRQGLQRRARAAAPRPSL
ncbi:MAG: cyclic nucleotide-binding domain-containing protein [bacterium]